ncbi:MAG: M48 family metallopeptidase [Rhodothermales bacterium]
MNFFEQQEQAKRRTGWLVALFAIAVALIVATVYFAAVLALRGPDAATMPATFDWWEPGLLALVAAGVLATVGVASGVRTLMLRSGGPAVAEMMGGRVVSPETSDPDERRLHNVVEEMALASGVPVPVVYVLPDEPAINAFAAGYSIDDAVVAVTDGALHALTRDELQGVIAHEFSHLLNRDSRLNIRLTGLIFGILALGIAGRLLLRSSFYARGGKKNQGALVMLAVGLALFLAGYLGVVFGRIIRAAVSRQREVLADAAAVQFTRNPVGLAGALKKIGAAGSTIQNGSAEEISHFFFANGMRRGLVGRLWATHPPLTERIRRLDPSFEGDFSAYEASTERSAADEERALGLAPAVPAGPPPVERGSAPPPVQTDRSPSPAVGAAVLDEIPAALREAVGSTFSAVATVYALMLDPEPAIRAQQEEILTEALAPPLRAEVLRLQPLVAGLSPEARLPLVDVAAPVLRQLSAPQARTFSRVLAALARIDGQLSIFEFALETIVQHRLAALLGTARSRTNAGVEDVISDAIVLLSALAHVGTPTTAEMQAAFRAGLSALTASDYRPVACTAKDLDGVLDRIGAAGLVARTQVVAACVQTVLHDRAVTQEEGQLLRAVAIALEAPLPPFLPKLDALSLAR